MQALIPIRLQNRWFLQPKKPVKCALCGHKFSFTMTREALLFWSGMCLECAPGFLMDLDELEGLSDAFKLQDDTDND